MKVLLAHAYFIQEDLKEMKIMKPYPPLGLLYISAYLESKNIDHKVFDSTFSNRTLLFEFIAEYRPHVVAFYANLMTKATLVQLIDECKKKWPDVLIALGGPDIRYNIEDYLKCGADFGIIGEGEESFYELIMKLENSDVELSEINGLAYKDEGCIKINTERKLMRDIDELNFPAYQNIDITPYLDTWKKHHNRTMMSISTQRGCPYTCKWCSTAVYGQTYRRRSPEKVIEEIKWLQDTYNPEALWFVDDVFTISHKWLKRFSELTDQQGVKVPFECISRADRMNEDVIRDLKKAGCFRVWIGAESGSQKILDAMDRRVKADLVREMIQLSKKHGIETGTFIMLGYPGETLSDIEETIDHLKRSDPDHFTITLAYPIKGTSLYNEVETIQSNKLDWNTQSDREQDFQRTYSRKFYDFAVRRVSNEVWYQKYSKEGAIKRIKAFKFLIKSKFLSTMMDFERKRI